MFEIGYKSNNFSLVLQLLFEFNIITLSALKIHKYIIAHQIMS